MKQAFKIFSAAFPLLSLACFLAWAEIGARGSLMELAITGYDPRDLLSGHYVRFRLDLKGIDACMEAGKFIEGERCVCFERKKTGEVSPPLFAGYCDAVASNCADFISGSCQSGRFDSGLEQFYIPEEYAPRFAVLPENSSIVVSVAARGRAQTLDLKVNGVPFAELVK